jgi:hypothetical protein
MISEDRNGALEVLLKLQGFLAALGVEGKDKESAEVVEECPCENLIRLELYLSHIIIV